MKPTKNMKPLFDNAQEARVLLFQNGFDSLCRVGRDEFGAGVEHFINGPKHCSLHYDGEKPYEVELKGCRHVRFYVAGNGRRRMELIA